MSVNKRLYTVYKKLLSCQLVDKFLADERTMEEFANLLNEASPNTPEEEAQRDLLLQLLYSNVWGFSRYLFNDKNRAGALILWTEGKYIAQFFKLDGLVHIKWTTDKKYTVEKYIPVGQRNKLTDDQNKHKERKQKRLNYKKMNTN